MGRPWFLSESDDELVRLLLASGSHTSRTVPGSGSFHFGVPAGANNTNKEVRTGCMD